MEDLPANIPFLISSKIDEKGKNPSRQYSLIIQESKIPNAGLGVFVLNNIPPNGIEEEYIGHFSSYNPGDGKYCWRIWEYDLQTGRPLEDFKEDRIVGYVDSKTVSHWTRFVNGSRTLEGRNLDVWQDFNRIYYGNREQQLYAGDELLVWYGDEYITEFL